MTIFRNQDEYDIAEKVFRDAFLTFKTLHGDVSAIAALITYTGRVLAERDIVNGNDHGLRTITEAYKMRLAQIGYDLSEMEIFNEH